MRRKLSYEELEQRVRDLEYAETDRIRAEAALKLSNERLKLVQKLAKIGPWEANLATGEFFWSPPVLDIFGQDPATFIPCKESFHPTLHPEDRARVVDSVNELPHGGLREMVYRIIRPDGEIRFVRELAKRCSDDRGNPVLIRGSIQDVTEPKLAEVAIRENEERFRALVECAPEGIFIHREGLFRYLNPAMISLLGASTPEEFLGTSVLDRIAPEYHEAVSARIRFEAETGLPNPLKEEEYLRLDGSRVPVETAGGIGVQFSGEKGYIVFVRDITARRAVEAEREALQTQLQQIQKLESIGQLAGGVAHDYNNMLSVILGFADLALGKVHPDDSVHGNLLKIKAAAERSASITRQLLAFARRQTIAPKVLDLNKMVDGMLTMLRRLIGENIDLIWLPQEDLGAVKMDPSQLDQIVANLCINARDAISGAGTVTIETRNVFFDDVYCASHAECLPGEFVMLVVSDDGCGMDRETAKRIFEPFFTTKGLGRGTGLGLATVYGIVKQNNGFINVYSEPGKGSTFKIYLSRDAGEKKEDLHLAAVPTPMGRGEWILAVEDEPGTLELIQDMLVSLGYVPLTTGNPAEALRIAEENSDKIALLITDVIMPEMNGRQLAERMQVCCPGLKSLFISGYTANVIVHRGILEEGLNFLQKPFSREGLALKIREALS